MQTDYFNFYRSSKKSPMVEKNEEAPLIYMPDALAGKGNLVLEKILIGNEQDRVRRSYKTSSLESAKELALNGLGLALLPGMVAASELKGKRLQKVIPKGMPKRGIGKHRLGVVYSRYREDSPILIKLIEELKQHSWS